MFIKYKVKNNNEEKTEFLEELPAGLRTELSLHLFKKQQETIEFFRKIKTLQHKKQINFIVWLCPLLKPNLIVADSMLQN